MAMARWSCWPVSATAGTTAKIPARTILQMMGLSDALYPKLHRWSIVMNGALGGIHPPIEMLEECEAVIDEQRSLFLAEIEARRSNPGSDFMSALVTAQDAGDQHARETPLGTAHRLQHRAHVSEIELVRRRRGQLVPQRI